MHSNALAIDRRVSLELSLSSLTGPSTDAQVVQLSILQMATQSASITDVITSSPTLMLGLGLYTVGLVTEFASEVDRRRFKSKPENKGKPYGGGLWSWATNINYGGYTLWRAGYAVSAAGLPWGAVVGGWFFYDFTSRAIPSLDRYCTEKVNLSVPSFLKPGR